MSKKNMLKTFLSKEILDSARKAGIDIGCMIDPQTPKFFVNLNKITAIKQLPGLILEGKEMESGVEAKLVIKKGMKIKTPIHLCFGATEKTGEQVINSEFLIEDGAEISIFAHCSFPKAKNFVHRMKARVKIGKNAKFSYIESHYHGEDFGAHVFADFEVKNKGLFETSFTLDKGTAGELAISVDAVGMENSTTKIESKILGRGKKDEIQISDKIFLRGKGARGLAKMRALAASGGKVFMQGMILASAAGARGHLDCQEIIIGKCSRAKAIPIVEVENEQARVTHEASVGKIDQSQLEALMVKGLSEDEAVDMVISGLF
jgi:hypothetical protein